MCEEKGSIIDQMKNHNHKKVNFKLIFKCLKFENIKAESEKKHNAQKNSLCEVMSKFAKYIDNHFLVRIRQWVVLLMCINIYTLKYFTV